MLDCIDTSKKLPTRGTPDWPWEKHEYARYLREFKGMTWPAISEATGVPERTIKSWEEKECWKPKGAETKQLEQFTRERFLELAAKKGMPKPRAVELLVEGMTEPKHTTVLSAPTTDKEGKAIEAQTLDTPDYATRHKYLKDYWTLVGLYSTNKQMEINNTGGGTVNVQVNIPAKTELA